MNTIAAIWRKEMTSHLVSPSLYGIAAVFLLVTGLNFWKLSLESAGNPTSLSVLLFGPMFFWIIALVLITALTMRTFAEEKRNGSLELLMTAPVRDTDVVAGKFLGALTVFTLILMPVSAYPWLLKLCSSGIWSVDKIQVVIGLSGVLLIGSFYIAAGVLISALARGPVLAAMGTFAALSVLFFLDAFWYAGPSVHIQKILQHVSAIQHVMDFSRGVLDSRAATFYLSGTGLLLFMAVKVIESRRWR
jgi:ABC-2 type transport system permease protein